ncbi:THAP domain-containing protein 1 isoform X1 [Xenopus laevis]|uniref:THAP domain-containing protein 1 isoform X1 n=2 Tax=Xenopus laevis TaxID=8355 RepID=A0A1L8HWG5_XENLA|nr:THAP domain-containing protein 1 isoform X1 [Xenopus laevis]XP_018080543.1 THAP domain-containing protein 1 isoform X1 [Xenopus laevis]OCU00472.1 hypothetical protein XELAEV_18006249mg [Xenopus laevis]
MPMTCIAYGCNNRFYKGCKKQFFRFPLKDRKRLYDWIAAIRRKNWMPSDTSRICSDHFTHDDYMLRPGAQIPRLRLDAVPSVFDGFPDDLKERLKREKEDKEQKRKEVHNKTEVEIIQTDGEICLPSSKLEDSTAAKEVGSSLEMVTSVSETDGKRACVANRCTNLFYDGCENVFFRMPMENPELLGKWVLAIQKKYWKPTFFCRICRDHFTEEDIIACPETLALKLRSNAVPSIFHVKRKKRRKKRLAERMAAKLGQEKESITEDHTYSSAQTQSGKRRNCFNSTINSLKKTVKTLQRQVQRQRQRISSLYELIKELRKRNKESTNQIPVKSTT